ncbi:Hint domain-containing protein [Roseobacter sp. CCS2]|uniref:Hint domain-containing protein n=1 Tax=Roseobacter sp. CCS2 TaxID=391593 RepID=UPI0000F3FBDC|nr:Hint domain-containing protein [Roseobacter sp. CCS2]EBA10870.1 type I secretion target repeat protein [Roseobacter sp. CCS2]
MTRIAGGQLIASMNGHASAGLHADDAGLDILKLIGADVDFITFDAAHPDAGVVTFTNGNTMTFAEIDRVVPCFTPGTAIATPNGEVLVEKLRSGDRILTRDNGIQTISWVGTKRLDFADLKTAPQLRPIKILAGALGDNMPERDMLVSPSHRMLIVSHQAEFYFGQSEILVAARHMLGMEGVDVCDQPYITYIHIMCQNHEIVLSDGAWSESFQPADFTLKGFDTEQREELFALFPELETSDGIAAYGAARRTLSRRESKLLFKV